MVAEMPGTEQKMSPKIQRQMKAMAPFLLEQKQTADPRKLEFTGFCILCETPGVSKSPSAEYCFDDGKEPSGQMWFCYSSDDKDHNCTIDEAIKRMRKRAEYLEIMKGDGQVIDFKTRKILKPKPETPKMAQWQATECTRTLLGRTALLKVLEEKRGLTRESVIEFGIGWLQSESAFTIPVYDRNAVVRKGELEEPVNVKLALHPPRKIYGKMSKYKWASTGGGHPLLFGDRIQPGDDVLVVEGEWDAILARQMGFNAVSATRGAGKWEQADTDALAGCHVTVLYDNDKAGHGGAQAVESSIKKSRSAATLRVVFSDVTGADVCDLVTKHGWDAPEFRALIDSAPALNLHKAPSLTTSGRPVGFDELTSRNSNKDVVESTVMINATTGLSKLPWRGQYDCDHANPEKDAKCKTCPLSAGIRPMELDREDRDTYLPMIAVDDKKVKAHLQKLSGARCGKFEVTRSEDIDVEHLIVTSPALGQTEDGSNSGKVTTVYMIGSHSSSPGDVVRIVGRCESEAKKQDSVFMAWHSESNNPLARRRVLSSDEQEALTIFRAPDDVSVYQHVLDIAASILAEHSIVGREELGAAYLLTYASALNFRFRNRTFPGWMQGMVVGDTRTGKSMVMKALVKHIGLGTDINCDVATRSGIVGGQGSHNGSYYAKMGLMPRADRQLVFLDETTNIMAGGELMKYLTGARTNGYVEIHQVNAARWDCRVRQVWIANPPEGKAIRQFSNKGIGAIKQLVGEPQDIARFDWLYATTSNAATTKRINTEMVVGAPSPYNPALLRMLMEVLWTREVSDIIIMPEIETAIGREAQLLGERYANERYNIAPAEEVGVKVARMAVAFAGLDWNSTNGVNLVVERRHVDAAVEFIDAMLGSDDLGFAAYCNRENKVAAFASEHIGPWEERIKTNKDYWSSANWISNRRMFTQDDFIREQRSMLSDVETMWKLLMDDGLIVNIFGPNYGPSAPARDLLERLEADDTLGLRAPDGT